MFFAAHDTMQSGQGREMIDRTLGHHPFIHTFIHSQIFVPSWGRGGRATHTVNAVCRGLGGEGGNTHSPKEDCGELLPRWRPEAKSCRTWRIFLSEEGDEGPPRQRLCKKLQAHLECWDLCNGLHWAERAVCVMALRRKWGPMVRYIWEVLD